MPFLNPPMLPAPNPERPILNNSTLLNAWSGAGSAQPPAPTPPPPGGGTPTPKMTEIMPGFFQAAGGGAIYDAGGNYISPEAWGQAMGGGAAPALGLPPVPAATDSGTTSGPTYQGGYTPGSIPAVPGGSQAYFNLPEEYLSYVPEQYRQSMADEVQSFLRRLGYQGTGAYGRYGETQYQRPGGPGPIWFDDTMLSVIGDPMLRGWLKWLLGERGLSARVPYPSA